MRESKGFSIKNYVNTINTRKAWESKHWDYLFVHRPYRKYFVLRKSHDGRNRCPKVNGRAIRRARSSYLPCFRGILFPPDSFDSVTASQPYQEDSVCHHSGILLNHAACIPA